MDQLSHRPASSVGRPSVRSFRPPEASFFKASEQPERASDKHTWLSQHGGSCGSRHARYTLHHISRVLEMGTWERHPLQPPEKEGREFGRKLDLEDGNTNQTMIAEGY